MKNGHEKWIRPLLQSRIFKTGIAEASRTFSIIRGCPRKGSFFAFVTGRIFIGSELIGGSQMVQKLQLKYKFYERHNSSLKQTTKRRSKDKLKNPFLFGEEIKYIDR